MEFQDFQGNALGNPSGDFAGGRSVGIEFSLQLKLQAFAKVARSHSGRIECLNQLQCRFQLKSLRHNAFGECQIVYNALQVPAQVARLVQIPDDVIGKTANLIRGIHQPQLGVQPLEK